MIAKDIARLVDGKIIGDENKEAVQIKGIEDAVDNSISMIADERNLKYLTDTKASIIITISAESFPETNATLIVVKNPGLAFARLLGYWQSEYMPRREKAIHDRAIISKGVILGKNVSIGANTFIDEGVELGDECVVMENCFIGRDTKIGVNAIIYPNVSIRENISIGKNIIIHSGVVIGSDGFGFVFDGKEHRKVPQIGTVEIGDYVEIGANTTIDRATIGATRIGKGTKIDNLVQVAHNVEIGEYCIICSQAGIAGSTKIGNYVTLAGQAGITGHIKIGDAATVAAQAGVTKDVPAKTIVSGYPAAPHREARELFVLTKKLPEIYKIVKRLEKEEKKIKN